jgi:hypothetical protein
MADIPHAVLSEKFQELLAGRRLKTAVFLTFTFEPDFFEQEILPAVMPDFARSQVPALTVLNLEDALKSEVDHVAVYYDRAGLVAGAESAKLDVRRIPTHHRTGCFHPKNIFLLTEDAEPDENGYRNTRMAVAALSANLTRAGWWENVEACHIEEVGDGDACGFRDDILDLIKSVKAASLTETEHTALNTIHRFVRHLTQRQQRTSNGVLYPRLYSGAESVPEFLDKSLDAQAVGICLEVISPYFNKHDVSPLEAIIKRFEPTEVRVFLPRGDDGEALCERAVYSAASTIKNVQWASLPHEIMKTGKTEQVKRRRVHAKVYRLFNPHRRYEALLVGSINLTTSAHSKGKNLESAFLVETNPARRPEWWLEIDRSRPSFFEPAADDEEGGMVSPLAIRFDWETLRAHAYWDATADAGMIRVGAQGSSLFELNRLAPRQWQQLPASDANALHRILGSTSFLTVSEDEGPESLILVQEDGMAQKPSILMNFSAEDILRWWTFLSLEQRAAAREDKFESIPDALVQMGIDAPLARLPASSIFAGFASIYHAFYSLERSVREALLEKRTRDAEYRLLGKKYDSLPSLLDRLKRHSSERDEVEQYVIALCAQQLVGSIEKEFPWFIAGNIRLFRSLKSQIKSLHEIGNRLPFDSATERDEFLNWFDQWFLRRADPESVA